MFSDYDNEVIEDLKAEVERLKESDALNKQLSKMIYKNDRECQKKIQDIKDELILAKMFMADAGGFFTRGKLLELFEEWKSQTGGEG